MVALDRMMFALEEYAMAAGLTAALLGVTHPHALAHLRTLQALPEVEQILLWDEDAVALAGARQAQGQKVAQVSRDLDALLKRSDVLFAIVCVPTDMSPAICLSALAAGVHLLAEKPIGRTAAEVERVVGAPGGSRSRRDSAAVQRGEIGRPALLRAARIAAHCRHTSM